jgi:hypothetical protein
VAATEGNEARPTPRAIRERLFKIRQLAKNNGIITHFSIGPTGTERAPTASHGVNSAAPRTPIFATPTKNGRSSHGLLTPSKTTATSGKKRKRRSSYLSDSEEAEYTDESDLGKATEDVGDLFTTPTKPNDKRSLRPALRKTYVDEGDEDFGARSADSDVDFDPYADLKEKKRKERRRRGIVDDFSDDF